MTQGALEDHAGTAGAVLDQVGTVVVGKRGSLELVLAGILAGGHVLLEDLPGLGKTLTARSFAQALGIGFRRLQFTPDLLPADVTGSFLYDQRTHDFTFRPGPIFTNLLLADEINRTPPKTQAALLQAMQERQVTMGTHTLALPDPFFVLATQNPIEQEGTYPLPEAQLDRFMFMVTVDYPSRDEEMEVLKRTTGAPGSGVERVLSAEQIVQLQDIVRRVPVGDHVYHYALDIVRATRPNDPAASDFVRHWLSWGAGPRAGQYLILAGKARALMLGRLHVTLEDIAAVASPVLRHRIVPNFNAEAEGIVVEQIIDKLLTIVPRGSGERLL